MSQDKGSKIFDLRGVQAILSPAEILEAYRRLVNGPGPSADDPPPVDMAAYEREVEAMQRESKLYTPPVVAKPDAGNSDYDDSPFDVDWKHK